MKPVTTHLKEKQIKFLDKKSEKTGIPKAELIRRAITQYINKEEK